MDLLREKCVRTLAQKYNKTPGQIILNWEIAQGVIPIPGTSKAYRMKENLGALNFKMSNEDIKILNIFGKRMKFVGCR